MKQQVQIETGWKKALASEFKKPYFEELGDFLHDEYDNETVYPPMKSVFRAFDLCPYDDVKVVIIGQDPYHGPKQANGLSFSVGKNVAVPPSLQNIYKEIQSDLGLSIPKNGDLTYLAEQGVLLLNATLTVRANEPGSHQGHGWETFTDAVIQTLSDKKENLVFILWGKFAEGKGSKIDSEKHLILTSAHPSPFSAHHGFFGSRHFSKTNEYLKTHAKKPIEWI